MRPGPQVIRIACADTQARAGLDDDLMAMCDQFPDAGWSQDGPVFVRLDLPGHTDAQVMILLLESSLAGL